MIVWYRWRSITVHSCCWFNANAQNLHLWRFSLFKPGTASAQWTTVGESLHVFVQVSLVGLLPLYKYWNTTHSCTPPVV